MCSVPTDPCLVRRFRYRETPAVNDKRVRGHCRIGEPTADVRELPVWVESAISSTAKSGLVRSVFLWSRAAIRPRRLRRPFQFGHSPSFDVRECMPERDFQRKNAGRQPRRKDTVCLEMSGLTSIATQRLLHRCQFRVDQRGIADEFGKFLAQQFA